LPPELIVLDGGPVTVDRNVPPFAAQEARVVVGQVPLSGANDAPTQSETVTFDSWNCPVTDTTPLTPSLTATWPFEDTRVTPPGTVVLPQFFVMVMPVEKVRGLHVAVLEVALADPPPEPPIVAVT